VTENSNPRYAYYPGCSLEGSAKEYDLSVRAVFAKLELDLVEIEDWNCCGAVHADVNKAEAGTTLPARNLALAEAQGFDTIVAPCSGCYNSLRRASKRIAADKSVRRQVQDTLKDDLKLSTDVEVLHPLYILLSDMGLERIKQNIVNPLHNFKVGSYYGCMLTRPKDVFDSAERPTGLDRLARILGAEAIDFPMKAKCCGGALALSHSGVTAGLSGDVLLSAKQAGADAVMLACPLCHMALDMYQSRAARAVGQPLSMPVLFFTQVIGLAVGLSPDDLGFKRHMVSPKHVLTSIGF